MGPGRLLIADVTLLPEAGGRIPAGWLLAQDGRIADYGAGPAPDVQAERTLHVAGGILLPGFIDIHAHGGAGHEVMDATPEALRAIGRFYAAHGVTGYLATTWTAPLPAITAALGAIAAAMAGEPDGARLLGAHLEGPYISPGQAGAQDARHIRAADLHEMEALLASGVVRLVTLAPEIAGSAALIALCRERGVTVSAGHTAATYDEMVAAVAMGLSQTTHTYNAMGRFHQREPGVIGAALDLPGLRCEVIADGLHVHPAALRLLWRARGPGGVMLVTDAVRGAGLDEGATYEQDGRTVTVRAGAARLGDGTLAGSTLTMDAALRHLLVWTGAALDEAWRASSLTPAQAIGLGAQTGSIARGKDADLVLLDAGLRVMATIVGGCVVFTRGD
jgi:N-acetylglucosamine-6-phosphate deacetylase